MVAMKATKIEPAGGEYVTMDDGRVFRRHSSDDWEELMGTSWEDISHRCEAHEAAYQAAKGTVS